MRRASRGLLRAVSAAALAWACAACTAPHLQWRDGPRVEDPRPSGPPDLRRYKESYYRGLGKRFVGQLTHDDALRQMAQARVLFIGDHHDDVLHHDRVLHLLAALRARGTFATVGLEAIGAQDRAELDGFLAGQISMVQLRHRVAARWPGSWLDNPQLDRQFYRALLRQARDWDCPAFPLEPAPRLPLPERDAVIAESIRTAAQRHPESLIVVIVGQAHLLGQGSLIERVDLPWAAVAARPSVSLRDQIDSIPPSRDQPWFVTPSGLLLHDPRLNEPMSRSARGPVVTPSRDPTAAS